MKPLTLILLFVLFGEVGLAQNNQWGLRIGGNVTRFQFDDLKGKQYVNPYTRYGLVPEVGLRYQHRLIPRLYIQTELTTGQRLNKKQGDGRLRNGTPIKWAYTNTWWISSLGTGLKYFLPVRPGGAYGMAGAQLECWHRSKMVETWVDPVKTQVFEWSEYDRNQFYMGYYLGIGYQRPISGRSLYVEGRYGVGMLEFKPLSMLHSYSYILSVGLWFGRKTAKPQAASNQSSNSAQ